MKRKQTHAFISSVITGMEDLRALVADSLITFQIQALTWEDYFGKINVNPLYSPQQACLTGVSRADFVVALIGKNYGDVQIGTGLSATHEEIRHAIHKGKHLVVLIDKDARLDERQQLLVKEAGEWQCGRRLFFTSFCDRGIFKETLHDSLSTIVSIFNAHSPAVLMEGEAIATFSDHKYTAIAQCGAFLAGDWSILGHGKALLVPIDARVRVAIDLATTQTKVDAYERSDMLWNLHEGYSRRMSAVVGRALGWAAARSRFPWLPHAIDVTCFSDVPLESGAHEDAAFCLCLASCLVRAAQQHENCVLPLAGAILSRWYPQISWATLLRAYIADEPGRHALLVSRNPRNINLRAFVYGVLATSG